MRPGPKFKVVRRTLNGHPAPTPQTTPCRLWQGRVDSHGYGIKSGERAHRWAARMGGMDVGGLLVRHLCDNRACFRRSHLEVGTHQQNMDDMVSRGRSSKQMGERNGSAILKESQAQAILDAIPSHGYRKRLMVRYGVSLATVKAIRSGRKWAHLERTSPDVAYPIEVEQ